MLVSEKHVYDDIHEIFVNGSDKWRYARQPKSKLYMYNLKTASRKHPLDLSFNIVLTHYLIVMPYGGKVLVNNCSNNMLFAWLEQAITRTNANDIIGFQPCAMRKVRWQGIHWNIFFYFYINLPPDNDTKPKNYRGYHIHVVT